MPLSIRECLEQGPATSKELQAMTGLSQSMVSRQLRGMGDSIISIRRGRSPHYAMTRNAFGGDDKLPLVMVDADGNNTTVAFIRPLAHGGFFVQPLTDLPPVLLGEEGDGLYDDLPFFLDDLRPQGFLGRQIAKALSSQSDDFPSDPRYWNTNHVGRYLMSNGDDLPGNFKFGHQAYLRVKRAPIAVVEDDYPNLANSVMGGTIPGSSAGGEQPKFTAYCGTHPAHVIVKFSPAGNDPVAQRWRDILITEFHAAETIRNQNLPAAKTRLIEKEERLFLESQRFDRVGEHGRLPMLSLHAIDAEFTELGSSWPQVMSALYDKDLISESHLHNAEILWCFGRLINNTDMHLGNLSLGMDGNALQILPVYDMCSMGFAPKSGEILPYNFQPPAPTVINLANEHLTIVRKMAYDFWERVMSDNRISDDFKAFLHTGNPIQM
ncbi:MAG: type II toxin-antitoxin system HipA family toxin YjjJ [Chromatiales bacterium]|nr:type II toxin-antitoxin system HipA family toxin YjjJ [Chromatiales bacterium]